MQTILMNLPRATYFTILVGAALWCLSVIAAPLLVSQAGSPAAFGKLLYSFFHGICHQLDGRSFHVSDEPLAVCSRCSSIYFAFLVGTFLYPLLRSVKDAHDSSRTWLIVAVSPMAFDVFAGLLGVHEVTNATRAITGATFGLLLSFVIIPAAIEAVQQLQPSLPLRARRGVGNA